MPALTIPFRRALAAAAVLLLLGACASTPPEPEVDFNPSYDFSAVSTVGMYRDSGDVVGANPLALSDMERERIDTALKRAIEAKGLEFVADPADADVLLSWHLATEDRTDVRTYETPTVGMGVGVGYARGYYPYNRYSMYSCWSCMPTRTEVSVREYTVGTFIVDMIDPALDKSVWRSVTSSRLKGQFERDQDKYDAAARRIMAGFPPQ